MLVHKFNFPALLTQTAGPVNVLRFLKKQNWIKNKDAGVKKKLYVRFFPHQCGQFHPRQHHRGVLEDCKESQGHVHGQWEYDSQVPCPSCQ